jgi:fructose-bisphosphate aldolase class II
MPVVSTAHLIATAVRDRVGVGAFNVITLEHAEAIVAGAETAGLPVILQVSQNAVKFHGGRLLPIARSAAAVAEAASVGVSLHLDHVEDLQLLHESDAAGFSSAMFDAGRLPYRENVEATRAAVAWAHERGMYLEAELGYVGGKADAPVSAHAAGVRTDPDEAAAFVDETGVDALAVAVGTSHAMTTRSASVDTALIAQIAGRLAVPLVLHGSSGVPDDEIRAGIAAGIAKVNVGTALNLAMTGAVREVLGANPDLVDPRKYLAPGRDAMAATVSHLLGVIGASAS